MKVLDEGCCWGDICIEIKEYFKLEEKDSDRIWILASSWVVTLGI